jgi:hypothetical protein
MPDHSPKILAGAIALAIIGLIGAYSYARADDAKPYQMAFALSALTPKGDMPVGIAVVKGGFATNDECMKEVNKPDVKKFGIKFGNDLSAHLGIPIRVTGGCFDVRKLPSKDQGDKPDEGEKL